MNRGIVVPEAESAFALYIRAAAVGAIFYLAQIGALMPLAYCALSVWPELGERQRFSKFLAPLVCGLSVEAGRWLGFIPLTGEGRRFDMRQALTYGVGFGTAELLRTALIAPHLPDQFRFGLLPLPVTPRGLIPASCGVLFFEASLSALAGAGAAQRCAGLFALLAFSHALLNLALYGLLIQGRVLTAQFASVAPAIAAVFLALKLWRERQMYTLQSTRLSEPGGDTGSIFVEELICAYHSGAVSSGAPQLGPVSFEVKSGQLLALLGPNGAGKTTTLRVLAGLLRPAGGKVSVFGIDISPGATQTAEALVGLAAEEPWLYPRMRVDSYLEFFARLYHLSDQEREDRIAELLRLLGLTRSQRARIATLSKGERQKLALARALVHQPRLLLLDEPTAALDPKVGRSVRRLLGALKAQARIIVIATHNLDEAQSLADQILILRQGQIVHRLYQDGRAQNARAAARFEVRLAPSACDAVPAIEKLAHLGSLEDLNLEPGLGPGEFVLSYSTAAPLTANPAVLDMLLDMGLKPYALTRTDLSVEQVYASEGEPNADADGSFLADEPHLITAGLNLAPKEPYR
jgi:ABC-2 type transport system ATP-binding protein